jgi:hypothetical protein
MRRQGLVRSCYCSGNGLGSATSGYFGDSGTALSHLTKAAMNSVASVHWLLSSATQYCLAIHQFFELDFQLIAGAG